MEISVKVKKLILIFLTIFTVNLHSADNSGSLIHLIVQISLQVLQVDTDALSTLSKLNSTSYASADIDNKIKIWKNPSLTFNTTMPQEIKIKAENASKRKAAEDKRMSEDDLKNFVEELYK